ncbi:MAG: LysR substrate-binding domain-containing protein [Pseudomonadota bacterium]
MRSLDIDQLKTFLAIAATGGFGRAAEQVHKTQAAVSVQMKRLEEMVGCRLIDRQARHSTLTPEGVRLRAYAARIIELNDEALTALQAPEVAGVIRIGIPLYMQQFFPKLFALFASTHPSVEVEIESLPSKEMLDATRDGSLDLALVTHRSVGQVGEIVRREPLHWVAAHGRDTHLQDVVPLAVYHASSALRSAATDALERVGIPYRIAYSSPSTDAILAAISSGLAIGVLPRCAITSELGALSPAHGFPELPECDISLVVSEGANGPLARALGGHLHECLSSYQIRLDPPEPIQSG